MRAVEAKEKRGTKERTEKGGIATYQKYKEEYQEEGFSSQACFVS